MQKSKATQARILEDTGDEYEGEYEDIADEDQGKVMKISLNAMTQGEFCQVGGKN